MRWTDEMFMGNHMMRTAYRNKSIVLSVAALSHSGFFLMGTERGSPDLFPDVETCIGTHTPFGAHIIHHSTHDTLDEALDAARNELQPMVEQTLLSMVN